ncbi:hypothetical protein GGR51DRAFT_208268 [Nemania sp. FL0031]|nr:hypothetical protein GGR51DRAFT_208268 [Nemania sp. FL0031]
MLNEPTPTLVPYPIMAYTSRPNLSDENVPIQYPVRNTHGSAHGSAHASASASNNQTSAILDALRSYDPSKYAHPNSHTTGGDNPSRVLSTSACVSPMDAFAPSGQPLPGRSISVPQPLPYFPPFNTNLLAQYTRHHQNMFTSDQASNGHTQRNHPVESVGYRRAQRPIPTFSVNYLGDHTLLANQSADVPDELNTAVWITNLPPNVDHRMLLDSVRDCGKIYAAVINGPESGHITAASKLVFFDIAGAQNLLRQARQGTFIVGSYIPRVRHNRIRSQERPACPNSRVLHINGPEWRFGSYRCQAEAARTVIERRKRRVDVTLEEFRLWQGVTVEWAVDPCTLPPGSQ